MNTSMTPEMQQALDVAAQKRQQKEAERQAARTEAEQQAKALFLKRMEWLGYTNVPAEALKVEWRPNYTQPWIDYALNGLYWRSGSSELIVEIDQTRIPADPDVISNGAYNMLPRHDLVDYIPSAFHNKFGWNMLLLKSNITSVPKNTDERSDDDLNDFRLSVAYGIQAIETGFAKRMEEFEQWKLERASWVAAAPAAKRQHEEEVLRQREEEAAYLASIEEETTPESDELVEATPPAPPQPRYKFLIFDLSGPGGREEAAQTLEEHDRHWRIEHECASSANMYVIRLSRRDLSHYSDY